MKKFILISFSLIISILFTACSTKIDPQRINKAIVPNTTQTTTSYLDSKTYNTYDEYESKITTYYFSVTEGELQARNEINYIPMDATGQLYSPFSQVVWTLNRLTNNRAKTIEEALAIEVKKHKYTKLYKDKEEYIIGNDFARDLKYSIKEFEQMIQKQDDKNFRINATIKVPLL